MPNDRKHYERREKRVITGGIKAVERWRAGDGEGEGVVKAFGVAYDHNEGGEQI